MSVTTTLASTADTISAPFGANIFLDTTKSIASFISDSVISSLGLSTDKDTFLVELKAFEESSLLMNLKIAVPNKKQAISLCAKWKNDPSKIYNSIINLLFVEDSEEES